MAVAGLSKYLFRPIDDVVAELSTKPVGEQKQTLQAMLEKSRHTARIAEEAMSALGLDEGKLLELAVEDPWRSSILDESSLASVLRAQQALATLTPTQSNALVELGIGKHDHIAFLMGRPVMLDMPAVTDTQETMGGFAQLTPDSVASGIVLVRDEGGGAESLFAFRRRSFEVARAFGKPHVDFMGCELRNQRLGSLLVRQGFEPATVEVPEVFGGGLMDVLRKRFDTRES